MIQRTPAEQDALYAKLVKRDLWNGPNIPEVVIISAERPHNEFSDNVYFTARLEDDIQDLGLTYKRVLGSWLGREEKAFVVILSGDDNKREGQIADLRLLARKYYQDAILHLDKYRQARLYHDSGFEEDIGKFKPTIKAYALQCAGYTWDVSEDQYYVVE